MTRMTRNKRSCAAAELDGASLFDYATQRWTEIRPSTDAKVHDGHPGQNDGVYQTPCGVLYAVKRDNGRWLYRNTTAAQVEGIGR